MSTEIMILQTLRLKGSPDLSSLVETLGDPRAELDSTVEDLIARSLCTPTPGGLRLTPNGHARLADLLTEERATSDHSRLNECYARFDKPNLAVKKVITDWQLVDGSRPNDHSDPAYDAVVLDRLVRVDAEFRELLDDIVELVPRLRRYRDRLATAVRHVLDGDHRWVSSPLIDSYHTVWFELHEELITAVGRTRGDEAAAGRAS